MECLNFTDAYSLAATAPIDAVSNTSFPFAVRLAQSYVNMVDYYESHPTDYYCLQRPPLTTRDKEIHRNMQEDKVAYVSYFVLHHSNRCICYDEKWANESIHDCIVRRIPQHCNDGTIPYFFTSDDFEANLKYNRYGNEGDRIVTRENHAARIFLSIAFIGALISCFIATLVYFKTPGLQTVANIFIINLMLANSIITVLAIPIQILETIVYVPYPWIIPRPYWLASTSCRLYYFIRYLGFYATSYSLALIGYERYNAICKPLESQRQMSKKRALKMVAAVWFLSGILTIPNFFTHVINKKKLRNQK